MECPSCPRHDRGLLLGAKRDCVLQLQEVHQYGQDSYGDANYVSLYGMTPAEWHARGVRILGRTAVECTRDALAQRIAHDISAVAGRLAVDPPAIVVDPFAGSANTLLWIVRSLPGARGVGFEIDEKVHALTQVNLSLMSAPIDYDCVDYAEGLGRLGVLHNQAVICFVAPPWGDALDPRHGLDLAATTPPVGEVIDAISDRFRTSPLLFAVQIYEKTTATSLATLNTQFDSTERHDYHLTATGTNHGIAFGRKHWPG